MSYLNRAINNLTEARDDFNKACRLEIVLNTDQAQLIQDSIDSILRYLKSLEKSSESKKGEKDHEKHL